MPELEQATPDGSLETAVTRLTGLLSLAEKKEKVEPEPEPVKTQAESAPKQAQPETEEEESPSIEAAKSEDGDEKPDDPPQPQKYKVKDNGQDIEVTLDEALKSYLRIQDYTRKGQALAEERRKFEAETVTRDRERDAQYAQHLEHLKTAVKAFMPEEPDWEKRKAEVTPDQLASELLQWQHRQKQVEKIEAQQLELRKRQEADAQRGFEQYVRDEQAKLEEKLPDMKDPEKAKTFQADLIEHGKSYGFSDQDLSQVSDHRLVLLLNDAMQFRKAQSKAPQIKNKIERVIETSAPGSKNGPPKANKAAEARTRLRQTGRDEDAQAAIEALLPAG